MTTTCVLSTPRWVLFGVMLFASCSSVLALKSLPLDGTWELRQSPPSGVEDEAIEYQQIKTGDDFYYRAQVPGYVQLDLHRTREIPGLRVDPFFRDAELSYRWVSTKSGWEYRRTVQLAESFFANQTVVLICEGIDTIANISVNGLQVGRTSNMFRRYIFNVGPALQRGANIIVVRLASHTIHADQRATDHPIWTPVFPFKDHVGNRNFLRKAQCHFGWDWAPPLLPIGIHRSIGFLSMEAAFMKDVTIRDMQKTSPSSSSSSSSSSAAGASAGGAGLHSYSLDVCVFIHSSVPAEAHLQVSLTRNNSHLVEQDRISVTENKTEEAEAAQKMEVTRQDGGKRVSFDGDRDEEDRLVFLQTEADISNQASIQVKAKSKTKAKAKGKGKAEIRFESQFKSGKQDFSTVLKRGENPVCFLVEAQDVEEWWPNGYGLPSLYDLDVQFKVKRLDGSYADVQRITRKIGFRTVELVKEFDGEKDPDPTADKKYEESFYFRINGVAIYAKGANWVPADVFDTRASHKYISDLLDGAKEANMNMIRVAGSGIYERTSFYDMCDRRGLMVWQDLMFASALYPPTDVFLKDIAGEVQYQVRRLSTHPSVVLWCGNSGIEEGLAHHWWPVAQKGHTQEFVEIDYNDTFVNIVQKVVQKEDKHRPYWSSSPSNGGLATASDPAAFERGDVHVWTIRHRLGIGSKRNRFRPRFVSEVGIPSFSSLDTLARWTVPEKDWRIDSKVMQNRDKGGTPTTTAAGGISIIQTEIKRYFPVPEKFGDLVYLSQVTQAWGLQQAVERWRREKPHNMGVLIWQLNDIWPAISGSLIEYGGRWKMAQYAAKRFFAPVALSALEDDDALKVWLVSDLQSLVRGTLKIQLWNLLSSESINTWTVPFELAPDEAKLAWRGWLSEMLAGRGEKKEFYYTFDITYLSSSNGHDNAKDTLVTLSSEFFLSDFKELTLPVSVIQVHDAVMMEPTNVTVAVRPQALLTKKKHSKKQQTKTVTKYHKAKLTLSSDHVALFVWLSSGKMRGRFSENWFTLLPGQSKDVFFTSKKPFSLKRLKRFLRTQCLNDIFHTIEQSKATVAVPS